MSSRSEGSRAMGTLTLPFFPLVYLFLFLSWIGGREPICDKDIFGEAASDD